MVFGSKDKNPEIPQPLALREGFIDEMIKTGNWKTPKYIIMDFIRTNMVLIYAASMVVGLALNPHYNFIFEIIYMSILGLAAHILQLNGGWLFRIGEIILARQLADHRPVTFQMQNFPVLRVRAALILFLMGLLILGYYDTQFFHQRQGGCFYMPVAPWGWSYSSL